MGDDGGVVLIRPMPEDYRCTGVLTEHGFKEGLELSLEGLFPGNNRVYVLVPGSKVTSYVSWIRSLASDRMTGNLLAHGWMAPCLDFVVATPEEANEYCYVFPKSVAAILVDACGDEKFRGEAAYFARNMCFGTVFGPHLPHLAEFTVQPVSALRTDLLVRWFEPKALAGTSDKFLKLIRSVLPEAENGWGDPAFAHAMHHFILPGFSYVCYDWSGVVGMIPVLARKAFGSKTIAVLVAPEDKLVPLIVLVKECVQDLGIKFPIDSGVVVLGPDSVPPPADCVSVTAVAEADNILETWPKWKDFIVRSGGEAGFHVNEKTRAIRELVRSDEFQMTSEKAFISLEHVHQFYALVEEGDEKRFEKLFQLLKQLEMSGRHQYSIYCHTAERADELAAVLKARGIRAFAVHSVSDPVLEEVYRNDAFAVTNVYSRGDYSVINYDMPDSDEDYIQRVGRNRNTKQRMVINLATKQELEKLSSFPAMVRLPSDCRNLHKKAGLVVSSSVK